MTTVTYVKIILRSDDPVVSHKFYAGLFDVEGSEGSSSIRYGNVVLEFVPSDGLPDSIRGELPICVVMDRVEDPDSIINSLMKLGARSVHEEKRGDQERLVCEDPSGNEFTILFDSTTETGSAGPTDLIPTSARGPSAERPTRRDWDRVADRSRLASMQNAISELMMPFSSTDPSGTIDEMRQKLGDRGTLDHQVSEADEQLEKKRREERTEELLSLYKSMQTDTEVSEPASATPRMAEQTSSPDPMQEDDDVLEPARPQKKTLTRAPEVDDEAE